MATVAPNWLNPPQEKWIGCSIQGRMDPNEYAVQLQVNGSEVAVAIPRAFVKAPAILPSEGGLRVVVVAYLPNDRALAELPAAPLNGTRRINVGVARLMDDWNAVIRS